MRFLLFPKMEEITDKDVGSNIVSIFLVVALISFLFKGVIVGFLYNPVSALVPGVELLSDVDFYAEEAKSLWSFLWVISPFFSAWVIRLSFLIEKKVTLGVRHFFVAFFLFLMCFSQCFYGIGFGVEAIETRHLIFYRESLVGLYMIGAGCWLSLYLTLFVILRFVFGWVK